MVQGNGNKRTCSICSFICQGEKPNNPRKGVTAIPQLKLVIEDLNAYYTETRMHGDDIDDFEVLGKWFWEELKLES